MFNILEVLQEKNRKRAQELERLAEEVTSLRQPKYDEQQIEEILTKQAQQLSEGEDIDLFSDISGPEVVGEERKKRVTSNRGGVMYIDLSFSSLPSKLQPLLKEIEIIAKSDDERVVQKAMKQIEQAGVDAVGLIFREVRMFYRKPAKRALLAELLSRLTLLNLKGRIMIKGVLEHATNRQHLELAIRTAGLIQEREVIPLILKLAEDPELFPYCFEALLEMRDSSIIQPLIQLIQRVDPARTETIEKSIQIARRFSLLKPAVIYDLFEALIACNLRQIRPIYTTGIRSFKHEAIPILMEIIRKETDPYRIRRACQLLGGIRKPIVAQKLNEALGQFPEKKAAIIEGIAHTRDQSFAPLLLAHLQGDKNKKIKEACLKALASCGTKDQIPQIRPYVKDDSIRAEALYALVSLGDRQAMDEFLHFLVRGSAQEQHAFSGLVSLLNEKYHLYMAEKMVNMEDREALMVLAALQKPNRLTPKIGVYLQKKLDQQPSAPVRLEIYRLIIKFANSTSNKLLPLSVVYEAKNRETDIAVKREIEQLLDRLPKRFGGVGTSEHHMETDDIF
ncbi:HEAT repeat domain-containing protein [Geobacillus proteiniphilus]|uniref:HEAT repeat domain-containing protein n=1 Tax=Geobacillus proteiniphilus TaxID=860353 RepID=A0A1Q5SYM7_9BACL|nr:HEAT repeat domain-containing protein [Geobacillus proteiniphilus]OKO93060.1 hypothetical protein BRO54_2123 [Geobacillus proteiniphilus]WMJ16379.1 HEAT repeat domain-containing protein [Geobacillus proteiniphilus]